MPGKIIKFEKKKKKINVIYGNWINFLKYNNKIIKYNSI